LFAGNGVVLKPSEKTPLVGQLLADLLTEAGIPEDLLQVVQGPGEPTGRSLVEAGPDLLVFTGSVATGRKVATELAGQLTPHVLELGGKDPMLVLDDADLDLAARGAAWGAFTNAGQTCAAVERIYVHEDVAQPFLDRVVAQAQAIRVGRGDAPGTDMGPMIDQDARAACHAQVEDARKHGATVLTGGEPLDELGPTYYPPTVLTDVTPEMVVMREETFGPVLPIQVVADDEEALALANDSPYGLSASVWTTDRTRGLAIARRLTAGTVTLNDCLYTYAACETPWGGAKDSGHGHTHGRWGLLAMTRLKHINRARPRRAGSPWYFPYDEDLDRVADEGFEFLYGSKLKGLKAAGPLLRRFRDLDPGDR
ncbi:MAG: aldehyde dehydrogenase family protein, partial [Candidatus Thermoplasmatota archaeon]|nr:aldehyde dehydrogenase family protein [Candidatus Thermoplasmatota archaeon]